MDLETLIPIIIVVAAYLFKAFENARKKDKEKEKRRPGPGPVSLPRQAARPAGKPFAGEVSGPRNVSQPVQEIPAGNTEREWWGETDYREPAAPKTERAPLRPEKFPGEDKTTSDFKDPEKNAADLPEEVVRIREMRRTARLPVPSLVPEPEEENEYADFDLREAVIQSAILKRPEL